MSAKIGISSALTTQAMSATWKGLLGLGAELATSNAQALDTLAAEMLPRVTALTNDTLNPDPDMAAAARRALAQVEVIVVSEVERLGLHDLAAESAKLAVGVQTAVTWLGVLVKAAVL